MRIIDSPTIKSLLNSYDLLDNKSKLILWDNGPDKATENDIVLVKERINNFEYIYSGENKGLSYIYNYTIQNYLNSGNDKIDYLIILDNDSFFNKNFFITLIDSINKNKNINLFVPVFKYKDEIISPADLVFIKMTRWKEKLTGVLKINNRFAINSGMVINANYLVNTFKGYDERMKFYGTDDDFILKYAKDNENFYVIDYCFDHDFSMFSEKNIEKELFRFRERKNTYTYVYSTNILKKIILRSLVFLLSVKYSIKHRNMQFFR